MAERPLRPGQDGTHSPNGTNRCLSIEATGVVPSSLHQNHGAVLTSPRPAKPPAHQWNRSRCAEGIVERQRAFRCQQPVRSSGISLLKRSL